MYNGKAGQRVSRDDLGQPADDQRQALLRQLAAARAARRGIAIVGVDCRLPGVPHYGQLWPLLRDGIDAITPVPETRWSAAEIYHPDFEHRGTTTTRWGGFIANIDHFDAGFFGVSPREAAVMDPQHRVLLSCAWHALEDAGLTRKQLAGSRTGVYLAQYQSDYAQLALADPDAIDAYTASGTHHGIAANRLSYLLDLRGPSVVVDTACSSSLVAVHLAMRALRRREIDRAIVAGVNLMINPEETIALSRWGVMAADGRCKTFDHRADGFVRGEGVAVLILARTEEAVNDGLPVRAQLLGSAVNQDGRSNGLTAPNGLAQQEVLREALRDAKLGADAVTMIEAHGTGTALGDPIEVEALAAVYGEGQNPCHLTSIKSKIGHLEAAAGLAGLLEALACIEHGEVAASLHIERLNPALTLEGSRLEVVRERRAWTGRRIAGVSAFGMGGTNAHVLLGQFDPPSANADAREPGPTPTPLPGGRRVLLPISAEDPRALERMVDAWILWLRATPGREAERVCAAATRQRSELRYRVAVVGRDCNELADALARWRAEDLPRASGLGRGPALLFPGQGGQWQGMGLALAASEPPFAAALAQCDAIISAQAGFSILAELARPEPRLDAIEIVQPLLFALSVAHAALWRSVGIEPAALIGHSMGEAAAAAVSGALSLEHAAWIIVERSRRMARLRGQGAMAVVGLGRVELEVRLEALDVALVIAAYNGPSSCVVSGPVADLDRFIAILEREGIELRRVDVEVASHHAGMDILREELLSSFARIEPRASEWPLVSTVEAKAITGEELDASYWFRNLRQPVQLWPVVEALLDAGVHDFIELGPHPVLLPAIREGLTQRGLDPNEGATIPSSRRASAHGDEVQTWLEALARTWMRGHAVALEARYLDPPAPLSLPRYSFSERRHWLDLLPRSGGRTRAAEPLPEDLDRWMHALEWQPLEPVAASGPQPASVVVGGGPLAHALASALRAAGAPVARASSSAELSELLASPSWSSLQDLRVLVVVHEQGAAGGSGPCEILTHEVSALAQILAELEGTTRKLWLLTRGGAPNLAAREPLAAAQFGLARVASIEHEAVVRAVIDLDPSVALDLAAAEFLGLVEAPEQVLALRGGARLGLRLCAAPLESVRPMQLHASHTYLIVGGFGGLGRELCQWLVDRGARHLLVLTRRALPPRARWSDSEDPAVAQVLELEAQGIRVYARSCDIGDRSAFAAVLGAWADEARPPIRGAIHAAGVQDHLALTGLDPARFEAGLRAKIVGSELCLELPELEFLVLCSSAATLLRSPLLASYVAGSCYQDALAERARAADRPVSAIGWGLWATGMSARYRSTTGRSAPGFEVMEPVGALACMERVLVAGVGHRGVMKVDWARWASGHGHEAATPLMQGLVEKTGRPGLAEGLDRDVLVRASSAERVLLVRDYLFGRIAGISRIPIAQLDAARGAASHGLDSLMAVELRNRVAADLGLNLGIVSILRSESLAAIALELAGQLELELEAESGAEASGDWETLTI